MSWPRKCFCAALDKWKNQANLARGFGILCFVYYRISMGRKASETTRVVILCVWSTRVVITKQFFAVLLYLLPSVLERMWFIQKSKLSSQPPHWKSACFLASTLKHGGWYLPKLYFYRSKCSKKNLKILNGKCGVAFCSFKVHRLQRILDFKFLQCNCMILP